MKKQQRIFCLDILPKHSHGLYSHVVSWSLRMWYNVPQISTVLLHKRLKKSTIERYFVHKVYAESIRNVLSNSFIRRWYVKQLFRVLHDVHS